MKTSMLILILLTNPSPWAAEPKTKGLLREIHLDSKNEDVNEARAMGSEILITRSENKALEALQSMLKKKKGTSQEAELLYRLAELYMRRSKSGRFFDLQIKAQSKQLSLFPVPDEKGADWIKKAIQVYSRIERDFKNYPGMDSVLFNKAFAEQQLGRIKESQQTYEKLLSKHPNSSLIPDALVSLGELYYDQRKFSVAADYLNRLEQHPESRVYSYGEYKLAWTYYNMSQTQKGVKKLLRVLELSPRLEDGEINRNKQYLRREALRDLTIFIGDEYPAADLVNVFSKIAKDEELGSAIMDLAKLYEGHSRHKEMNIFLNEFIDKFDDNIYLVDAHLSLVQANEAIKDRPKVLEHLRSATNLCALDSKWRLVHEKNIPDTSCQVTLKTTAKEIAEKWWEIWLKNKKHQEFTGYTEQAIKIILDYEDRSRPDLKTHYAYAELLFALERYDESSEHYKLVSDRIQDEPKLRHDATYAALFAKEKSILKDGQNKSALKEGQRKDLALNYIEKYPYGAHSNEVSFRLAGIFYDEANFEESERWLQSLSQGQAGSDFQTKAEDMLMDIYNLKKDYRQIQNLAKRSFTKATPERKQQLTKLLHEASYAEIQDLIKSGKKLNGADKLVAFFKDSPENPLSKEALWQSIGLYFTEGAPLRAAQAVSLFFNKYPQDSRNEEALKDAAKVYIESAQLIQAADTLKNLAEVNKRDGAKHLELAADLLVLEKKYPEARAIYNRLLSSTNKDSQKLIYQKLMTTYIDKQSPEYQKAQSEILNLNIEPFASEYLYSQLKILFDQKKYAEAFESAKKIINREGPSEVRAKARLIQAQILEKELFSQSLKSSQAERLGLVLTLKTEKLEKAQTAYLGASKISPDATVQLAAFTGIDRCYSHFVESLKAIPLPEGMTADDKMALKNEISLVVTQIEDRRRENLERIRPANEIDNKIYPPSKSFAAYLPANNEMVFSKLKRYESPTSIKCDSDVKNNDLQAAAASCYYGKNPLELQKIALKLYEEEQNKYIALYYLSLSAELQGLAQKSLWLSEYASKLQTKMPLFIYQKARMTYQLEGMSAALPVFEEVLDTQLVSIETRILQGIKAFSLSQFENAIQKLSLLDRQQLYTLGVGPMLLESYEHLGQKDQALKVANEMLKQRPDQELKNWLEKKLDELKDHNNSRAVRKIGRLGYEERL